MKRKFRVKTVPLLITILALVPLLTIFLIKRTSLTNKQPEEDLVTEETISDSLPVINTTNKMINPYTDKNVKIGKTYYDYKGEEKNQENSITVHDNTYMQNTGIDFISDQIFDVVSVQDGTVINVKEDNLLGKVVEIKHESGLISSYQSLSEISVKKGETITQGQIIGKSGTNELDKESGNHLHFEIYKDGTSVNPENYLNEEKYFFFFHNFYNIISNKFIKI